MAEKIITAARNAGMHADCVLGLKGDGIVILTFFQ